MYALLFLGIMYIIFSKIGSSYLLKLNWCKSFLCFTLRFSAIFSCLFSLYGSFLRSSFSCFDKIFMERGLILLYPFNNRNDVVCSWYIKEKSIRKDSPRTILALLRRMWRVKIVYWLYKIVVEETKRSLEISY